MPDSSKPRVLFIDDAADIISICKIVLKDANLEIQTAETGAEGVSLAHSFKPNVIFLDMVLPDLNGIEVAEKIFSGYSDVADKPVIYAFTNHRPDYFGNQLEVAGIKKCVQKAIDLDSLKTILTTSVAEAVKTPDRKLQEDVVNLLLVEDNPADVQIFKMLFKDLKWKHEIHTVNDGEAATNYMFEHVGSGKAKVPDLIFLDINLPKKDGKKVLKELKEKAAYREIPVIILTTTKNNLEIRECYDLHANCFVSKPMDLLEYKNIVKQIGDFWLNSVSLPKPKLQLEAI